MPQYGIWRTSIITIISFKEETTFDKTTSIYNVFLNIETIITN